MRKKREQNTETQTKEARIARGKKRIFKDNIEESFPEPRLLFMCRLIF